MGSLRSLKKKEPSVFAQFTCLYQVSLDGCNWIDITKDVFFSNSEERKKYPYVRFYLSKKIE
jgi:hypothetical protein